MTKVSEITSKAIADIIEYYKPVGSTFEQIIAQLATNTSFDDYSTVLTKDANGNTTQVQVMDGANIFQTTDIIRDTDGNVTSILETLSGKTVTTTINRATDGAVLSTSKEVL